MRCLTCDTCGAARSQEERQSTCPDPQAQDLHEPDTRERISSPFDQRCWARLLNSDQENVAMCCPTGVLSVRAADAAEAVSLLPSLLLSHGRLFRVHVALQSCVCAVG